MALLPFLDFTPVPVRPRHDGWTVELQRRFVAALSGGASIEAAARSVGKSRTTAYALRKHPGAEGFATAWDLALAFARRMRIAARQAADAALPPPAATREEAAALLDRLYPGWRGKTDEAGKADGVDGT